MRYDKERITRICSICGDCTGGGYDHTECAKAKKEIYGDTCERKNPNKKLSKKQCDDMADYINISEALAGKPDD